MRETFHNFRCAVGRFKFVSAILGVFLSGALLALGTSAWHYGRILDLRSQAYERQVSRLQGDVDQERVVTRHLPAPWPRSINTHHVIILIGARFCSRPLILLTTVITRPVWPSALIRLLFRSNKARA